MYMVPQACIISYRMTSHHVTSYRIISYVISYHIVLYYNHDFCRGINGLLSFLLSCHPSVPPEIQARGIEAEHAFQRALKKGKVRVYRGRVMLIGQNRAGKTSLKKSLLGLTFDPGEPSTDGIEIDPSRFEVDVNRVMNWQLVKNEKFTSEFADDIARLVVGELTKKGDEEEEKPATGVVTESEQSDVTQGVAATPQAAQVWWEV